LIKGFPYCPVERLLSDIHDFNGSKENITQLYDVLTWIENHEVELSKLRRILEKKTIDYRFKDIKV
jgi:hypothetical protein